MQPTFDFRFDFRGWPALCGILNLWGGWQAHCLILNFWMAHPFRVLQRVGVPDDAGMCDGRVTRALRDFESAGAPFFGTGGPGFAGCPILCGFCKGWGAKTTVACVIHGETF